MSPFEEPDYHRVVDSADLTQFLDGTSIEIIHASVPTSPPEHVLFDFDGTLSLIREGWPAVMVPMMVEILTETGTDESSDELATLVNDFVMKLTGKQTIYQMMRLVNEVEQRGGRPRDPEEYKQLYHDLLMQRIEFRRDDLSSGRIDREEMLVPGSLELLNGLRRRGTTLYLASGTDEQYVKEEVELLGLTDFFGEHIHGAVSDYKNFSKAQVIQRILDVNRVDGDRLLGFGDGYVEIQNIKSVGGFAVAVASDEANRSGRPDPWKRDRLIGVGADVVVPDFGESRRLLDYLVSG